MARGRKKNITNENILDVLNNKLIEKRNDISNMEKTLSILKQEEKELEEQIRLEEFRQLKSIMDEKNISFDDVKQIISNTSITNTESNVEELEDEMSE